jgi:hypothetical protein
MYLTYWQYVKFNEMGSCCIFFIIKFYVNIIRPVNVNEMGSCCILLKTAGFFCNIYHLLIYSLSKFENDTVMNINFSS